MDFSHCDCKLSLIYAPENLTFVALSQSDGKKITPLPPLE